MIYSEAHLNYYNESEVNISLGKVWTAIDR